MTGHLLRRIAVALPMLLLSTLLVFLAVSFAGDPLSSLRQPNIAPETLRLRAHELGLDRPVWERYANWLGGAVRGDLGHDLNGQSVAAELSRRGLVTLRLAVPALALAILLALTTGFWAAVRRGRWPDRLIGFAVVVLLTLPEFWIATVLKQGGITLNRWTGAEVVATLGDAPPGATGSAAHLVLPVLTLALTAFPLWSLYQRAATLEVLDSDYLLLARAKGLSRPRVLLRHALRTSLTPLVTVVALQVPWLVGGLVVIENVFGWHGLGEMLVEGVKQQDTNTVLAFLLVSAVLVTLLNLLADLLYGVLDPKVTHG
ncbi:ABC transporter permease [Nonomuraea sp. NPDC050547]|uniref:ABC transporter permease n=1 Tax=Nonomuraea sp. NPDC050547 TaxID=3364368 RepID=UPI0037A203CD